MTAGGVGTARFPAPRPGEKASYAIVAADDDLAADDALTVERRGGAHRVRLETPKPCPHLEAALRAAGAEISGEEPADVVVAYQGEISPAGSDRHPWLHVWPRRHISTGALPSVQLGGTAGGEVVRGDQITGREVDVLPAPGALLVVEPPLLGGTPLWSAPGGVVAAAADLLVVVAVDPEDPRGDWSRDPSFPAFIAAALDRLTDGPDRLVPLGAVPVPESAVVHDPPRTSGVEEIRACVRRGAAERDAPRPGAWLAAAAAALLAAVALIPRSGR
jgi:hypothetical protein